MVTLRPMTEEGFQDFLARSIPEYAEEKVKAGNWTPEEALNKSQAEYTKLLPQGLATPHQHIYAIELEGGSVGCLWLSADTQIPEAVCFIYDLFVEESFRRSGIATEAMRQLEKEASLLGLRGLALHVFGHNTAARDLYQKLGYEITNVRMSKSLSDD